MGVGKKKKRRPVLPDVCHATAKATYTAQTNEKVTANAEKRERGPSTCQRKGDD